MAETHNEGYETRELIFFYYFVDKAKSTKQDKHSTTSYLFYCSI